MIKKLKFQLHLKYKLYIINNIRKLDPVMSEVNKNKNRKIKCLENRCQNCCQNHCQILFIIIHVIKTTKNLLPHRHITDNYSKVNAKCELYLASLYSKMKKLILPTTQIIPSEPSKYEVHSRKLARFICQLLNTASQLYK